MGGAGLVGDGGADRVSLGIHAPVTVNPMSIQSRSLEVKLTSETATKITETLAQRDLLFSKFDMIFVFS